ncbi:GNAT family N-acetyltransferase [Hathewaya histolytica]|uniref:Acetyltransferase, GNAT family n=1 Tax=Hathewaya histolytica TaxID=1498 RepID=A0A4U9RLK7_HATHI|nr:GNAT family N-acetyltransferase [Hathewaya histolytica]VTQ91533.1 acetyltransferase, GNAT family [Hathewaya histolytica]
MINKIVYSSEEDNEYIHSRLREYNKKYMRGFDDYNFHIKKDGKIIAGIVAVSTFDTLEVEFLFVDENHRGKNLGTELLQYAENAARINGLKRILLNTYSFQAPEFYKKLGYSELFKIEPCFEKFSQSYFIKNL